MPDNQKITPGNATVLFITVLLWGWAFPLVKITLDFVPPLVVGYFRYFFASLPFIGYLLIKNGYRKTVEPLRSSWPILIALGVTVVTLPNIFQNIGLLYTTSSIAALITTAAPVFTVIIALTFLKESKSILKIVGLIIAIIASIVLVVHTGLELSESSLYGNLLVFFASISYGMSGIVGKLALRNNSAIHVTGFSMLFGALILMPISILFNEPVDWAVNLPLKAWWYLLLLTLFSCMLATYLWYVVLKGHEISRQIMFTYLIPVFAAVFAYFMLGETLTMFTIVLGGLILLGITLAEIDIKETEKKINNGE
jgi:drug/metabolite transporter (DMT)-like permease